jgi:hypothetical protein
MRTLAEIVSLRTSACRDAEAAIVSIAAGDIEVDEAAARHVAVCLRCQAEVAAYRRVMAVMRSMRHTQLPTPGGALESVLRNVRPGPAGDAPSGLAAVGTGAVTGFGPFEGAPPWAVRAAYVGGLTAAGAAGILVWMTRRRPGLAQAS